MQEGVEKTKTPEGKEEPKRVFIEIGTGEAPVPWLGERKFGTNEIYIGIDKNQGDIHRARRNVEEDKEFQKILKQGEIAEEKGGKTFFVEADAEHLPVADDKVDEVFFGNILDSPGVNDKNIDSYISEAKRILKEDGIIIIKSTNTPRLKSKLNDMVKKHELVIDKYCDETSPDWLENIKLYSKYEGERSLSRPWKNLYNFLVFLKPRGRF